MTPEPSPRGWSPARLLLGLAGLLVLVAVVARLGDARELWSLARHARPGWLLGGVALQAATYATEAGVWYVVLRRAGAAQPLRWLYGLSLLALFANQLVPTAGVAGLFLVVHALERKGVAQAAAVAAVLVDLVGFYAAYGVAVAAAIVILQVDHELPTAVLGMAAALALVGVAVAGATVWLTAPKRPVPALLRRVPPLATALETLTSADPALVRSVPLVLVAWGLRAANFALDALTLWVCLRAIGVPVGPHVALAPFVLGSLARNLGIVPAGLGTFEAATTGGLALFGVPVEAALAATLLFRGLSFWLPMLPGLWLGRRIVR